MDMTNPCVHSTTGSPSVYLNGLKDINGENLNDKFLEETNAHTLTIDLRVVRMRPTVLGKRINPTAVFNEIVGEDSVQRYYDLFLKVLEAVSEESNPNSDTALKIFAFGGVPHAKMKSLLKASGTKKLKIDPEFFEMHPESLISGRDLPKDLGGTTIEEIIAASTTVCSRAEAYARSDKALQERLKALGIENEVTMYKGVYEGRSKIFELISGYRSQQGKSNYAKSWAPFAAAMTEDKGEYFEGLSDLGLLGLPLNSPEWDKLSGEEIVNRIASKRSENGQASLVSWR
jgi:hypothetical protein